MNNRYGKSHKFDDDTELFVKIAQDGAIFIFGGHPVIRSLWSREEATVLHQLLGEALGV